MKRLLVVLLIVAFVFVIFSFNSAFAEKTYLKKHIWKFNPPSQNGAVEKSVEPEKKAEVKKETVKTEEKDQEERYYLRKRTWKLTAPSQVGSEPVEKSEVKKEKPKKVVKKKPAKVKKQKNNKKYYLRKHTWKMTPPSQKQKVRKEVVMRHNPQIEIAPPSSRYGDNPSDMVKKKPRKKSNMVSRAVEHTKRFWRSLRGHGSAEEKDKSLRRARQERNSRWGGRRTNDVEIETPEPVPPEQEVTSDEGENVKHINRTVYKDGSGRKKSVPAKIESEDEQTYENEGVIARSWRKTKNWFKRDSSKKQGTTEPAATDESGNNRYFSNRESRTNVKYTARSRRNDHKRSGVYHSRKKKTLLDSSESSSSSEVESAEPVEKEEMKDETEREDEERGFWSGPKRFWHKLIGKE